MQKPTSGQLSDIQIATILGITRCAVNKIKNRAIMKLIADIKIRLNTDSDYTAFYGLYEIFRNMGMQCTPDEFVKMMPKHFQYDIGDEIINGETIL